MGTKRVGLARTQALIENLKRSLDFNGATFTDVIINTGQDVTVSGTTTLSGNLVASGYKTGIEGVTHSAAISASSGSTWASGALAIPAHAIITDIGVVVTTLLAADSGNFGLQAGTSAAGTDIAAAVANSLSGAVTSVAVGKGCNTVSADTTAMGGNAVVVVTADKAYAASARDIHLTLTAAGGSITAGTVRFWVKYIHVEG